MTTDLDTFRRQARAWLADHCPAEMRVPMRGDADICWGGRDWVFASDAQRDWLQAMAGRGWTVPLWPEAYGGGGLSPAQAEVLSEELAAIGARPPLISFGISMLGPALLRFGTERQRRTHLPPIARGEVRWCQGYSEPNAGSDLAGLGTRAEDDGDAYLVSGQKIWTSYADRSDWMFCLVRTDPANKHGGISFVLLDMAWPGVSTHAITLISGKSPFCEVFLDGVRVPKANRVGDENAGWTVAKFLLSHERQMIGEYTLNSLGDQPPLREAAAGALGNPLVRADVARWEVDEAAFAALVAEVTDAYRNGKGDPTSASTLKYYAAELNKRRFEVMMAAAGSDGLAWHGEAGELARRWLRTKGNSIEGGTSEIQLNILAKHRLGLPSK